MLSRPAYIPYFATVENIPKLEAWLGEKFSSTTFNPIRPGVGSEARMAKLTAANQKPLILWCPNLVTLSFYPWDTFWPHFSKIGQSGGLLLLFSHRDIPKILKMKNFSYAWKVLKLTWRVNFGSRRTILDIKTHFFFKLDPFSGGKYPNFMTCSLLLREILWRHIFKTRRAIRLKFYIRNAFMAIMIRAKFHFNWLMLTLIFGIWASEPPRAWRTTEKAGPDRVNITDPLP